MEKVDKEHKRKIMDMIRKAGDSENYEVSYDERGIPKVKNKENKRRGKKAKTSGRNFELKVRKDLESKGRIVDKWSNNVDLEEGKIIPAKRKYNPFRRAMTIGTGFPDFISLKYIDGGLYSVIGVEVKMNGRLSKVEKQKCAWYLKNKVFSQIWIAKKGEKRGMIEYDDFLEKYGKKYDIPKIK